MHNMKGLEYSESVERAQHILKKKNIAKYKKHLLHVNNQNQFKAKLNVY